MAQELIAGCGLYDRTRPMIDGRVSFAGPPWRVQVMSSPEATRRSFGTGELDAAEVSFGAYLERLDQGLRDYLAMPIFLSRAFRHNALFKRVGANISCPADLAGKRIGLPDYSHTTPVWVRGILHDRYGLDWKRVQWVVAPLEDQSAAGAVVTGSLPPENVRPPSIEVSKSGKTVWQMLEEGDLDAVLAVRRPPGRSGTIERVVQDYPTVEREYYRETKCFPILHFLVIRASLLKSDAAASLYDGFERSLRVAQDELADVKIYQISLPWLSADAESANNADGTPVWSYGTAGNTAATEAFERYCFEQGYTRRRFSLTDMFPAGWPGAR